MKVHWNKKEIGCALIIKLINEKFKVAGDLIYTIGATVVMQIVLHIIIYPLITRIYGESVTGNILYFMGIVYIFPQAIGSAISNVRLVARKKMETSNGDFSGILMATSVLLACFSYIISYGEVKSISFAILFAFFSVVYSLRLYAQVEFRLNLNFKGYFIYYLIISIGYLIGMILYFITDVWVLIFLVGELSALGYSIIKGNLFKREKAIGDVRYICENVGLVMFSLLIRDGVNQFDKVILKLLISAEIVTYYNALSVVGKSIQMLVGPVNTLILSYLSVKTAKIERAFFKKFTVCSLGIGILALLGCQIATPLYIKLFYGGFPTEIMSYCILINAGLILGFVASLFTSILLSHGETKIYTAIQTVWGVSYIVLAYFFTQSYGLLGLISVTFVVNGIKLLIGIMLSSKVVSKKENE